MVDNDLTEAQLRNGYEKCIENVQNLLDSAKLLLTNENTHQYALGLYMYAIEEYGKAVILKNFLTENKIKYSIPGWIFGKGRPKSGRTSHEEKLLEGFKKLPSVCLKLSKVIEITYNTSAISQTFTIKKENFPNGSVSVPPFTSGIFEDPTTGISMEIDPDLKTACFYVDWINGSWNFVIPVDKDQLTYNIERMKEAIP